MARRSLLNFLLLFLYYIILKLNSNYVGVGTEDHASPAHDTRPITKATTHCHVSRTHSSRYPSGTADTQTVIQYSRLHRHAIKHNHQLTVELRYILCNNRVAEDSRCEFDQKLLIRSIQTRRRQVFIHRDAIRPHNARQPQHKAKDHLRWRTVAYIE